MTKTLLLNVVPPPKAKPTQGVLGHLGQPIGLALLCLALHGGAQAQALDQASANLGRRDTVSWTVVPPSTDNVKPGARLALTLRGEISAGWHVYGFKQLPTGPTPLVVKLDANDVATAAGAPVGSPPVKTHDPSFDLETQYYSQAFTVTVPVRIGPHLAAGRQLIPVSVRYQTCDGQICQPPKTVQLSAAIIVRADG